MITDNMSAFIKKNEVNKIVFGDRRTPDNKPVLNKSDLDLSDRVLYKFDDDTEFTLTKEDVNSAPDFKPIWDL